MRFFVLCIAVIKKVLTFVETNKEKDMKAAKDLKVGDTFRKQGFQFVVKKIETETYINDTPSLLVSCSMGKSDLIDSFFHFKLETKIK